MPFIQQINPAQLPAIVCGPIVRRLTRTRVHVWVALSAGDPVQLTVFDAANNATVTVARNMAGSWTGGREPGFNSNVSLNLNQSGTSLSGSVTFSGNLSGTLSGLTGSISTAAYPTNVTWQTPSFSVGGLPGTFQVRFSGTVDATGNLMNGTITTTSTALKPPSLSQATSFRR